MRFDMKPREPRGQSTLCRESWLCVSSPSLSPEGKAAHPHSEQARAALNAAPKPLPPPGAAGSGFSHSWLPRLGRRLSCALAPWFCFKEFWLFFSLSLWYFKLFLAVSASLEVGQKYSVFLFGRVITSRRPHWPSMQQAEPTAIGEEDGGRGGERGHWLLQSFPNTAGVVLEGPAALTNIAHLPGPPEKSHALYPSYSQGCRIMVCTFSCPPSLSLKSDFNEVHSGSSGGKESAYNAGDLGLIPGLGRSAGEGTGNPIQYSCLKNSMDRGAGWATQFMGSQRVGHYKWLGTETHSISKHNQLRLYVHLAKASCRCHCLPSDAGGTTYPFWVKLDQAPFSFKINLLGWCHVSQPSSFQEKASFLMSGPGKKRCQVGVCASGDAAVWGSTRLPYQEARPAASHGERGQSQGDKPGSHPKQEARSTSDVGEKIRPHPQKPGHGFTHSCHQSPKKSGAWCIGAPRPDSPLVIASYNPLETCLLGSNLHGMCWAAPHRPANLVVGSDWRKSWETATETSVV